MLMLSIINMFSSSSSFRPPGISPLISGYTSLVRAEPWTCEHTVSRVWVALPVQSPLLKQARLLAIPPLSDMLKFSGSFHALQVGGVVSLDQRNQRQHFFLLKSQQQQTTTRHGDIITSQQRNCCVVTTPDYSRPLLRINNNNRETTTT